MMMADNFGPVQYSARLVGLVRVCGLAHYIILSLSMPESGLVELGVYINRARTVQGKQVPRPRDLGPRIALRSA